MKGLDIMKEKIKNMWLAKHPETRILKHNGRRVQVCHYNGIIAFCTDGSWYETNELEPRA